MKLRPIAIVECNVDLNERSKVLAELIKRSPQY